MTEHTIGSARINAILTSSAMVGVMCYSSRNLTDWKNEGVALSVVDNDSSDIARGCILERPKVIYNAKNREVL